MRYVLIALSQGMLVLAGALGCGHWQVSPHYIIRHSEQGSALDIKEVAVTDGSDGYLIYACENLRVSHSGVSFDTRDLLDRHLERLGCHLVSEQPGSDGSLPESLEGHRSNPRNSDRTMPSRDHDVDRNGRRASSTIEAGTPPADPEGASEAKAPPVVPGTGTLGVISVPAGAAISIDGKDSGIAPLLVKNVAAGRHTIAATFPDGHMASLVEEVRDGKTTTARLFP